MFISWDFVQTLKVKRHEKGRKEGVSQYLLSVRAGKEVGWNFECGDIRRLDEKHAQRKCTGQR